MASSTTRSDPYPHTTRRNILIEDDGPHVLPCACKGMGERERRPPGNVIPPYSIYILLGRWKA